MLHCHHTVRLAAVQITFLGEHETKWHIIWMLTKIFSYLRLLTPMQKVVIWKTLSPFSLDYEYSGLCKIWLPPWCQLFLLNMVHQTSQEELKPGLLHMWHVNHRMLKHAFTMGFACICLYDIQVLKYTFATSKYYMLKWCRYKMMQQIDHSIRTVCVLHAESPRFNPYYSHIKKSMSETLLGWSEPGCKMVNPMDPTLSSMGETVNSIFKKCNALRPIAEIHKPLSLVDNPNWFGNLCMHYGVQKGFFEI